MNGRNKESSSHGEDYRALQRDQSDALLESEGEDESDVLSGVPLSYRDRLRLELERDWIRNTISNLRDTGRALLGPIGFLLGFYGVAISLGINSGLVNLKADELIQKLIGMGPPVFWILALFFTLISIRPTPQRVGSSLEQIEQIFDRYTRRIRMWIRLALWFFFAGTLWFIIIMGVIVF
jgi:hypothetical protein